MRPKTSLLAALGLAACAWGELRAGNVTHCPQGARPARTVNPIQPWACILSDERYQDGIDCPAGSRSITTSNAQDPFKCAVDGLTLTPPRGICPPGEQPIPSTDPGRAFDCERVGKGFSSGPRCPRGTRPLPTPGALQAFKCVAGEGTRDASPMLQPRFDQPKIKTGGDAAKPPPRKKTAPRGECPEGTTKILTENPFEPVQCLSSDSTKRLKRLRYRSFKVQGQLSFQYPDGWHLTDAWKDEQPSIYIMLDTERDGKPVSLSINRHMRKDADFADLETRIWREQDWHGFKRVGKTEVSGRSATLLSVKGESDLVFVPIVNGYLAIAFSSPTDLYEVYSPAFRRLLDTLNLVENDEPVTTP
ncbi:MAG: hypothetical protein A2X36_01615 [Elusimicrobia bacterium GWA2_69_24]|nr:MAG: hypothetical protein A2X36_01615 [Elusimicrobia bacterium GWA2_69_24]HBL19141.1 hypothetical protein [Elusimicrobiota bacterium]